MLRGRLSKPPASLGEVIFNDFSSQGRMYPEQFERLCATRLKYTDVDDVEIAAAFVQLDSDNEGHLSLDKFQRWWKMNDGRHDNLKSASEDEKQEIERIRKSFFNSTGGFGHMTPEQFQMKCYVSGYCLSEQELAEAFDKLDKDNSGSVDFIEYFRWRRLDNRFEHLQHDDEDDAVAAYVHQVADYFRIYDTELKGFLDREHFEPLYQHLLEHDQVDQPIASVMEAVDSDNDGQVSLNEFIRWYLKDVADFASDDDEAQASGPADAQTDFPHSKHAPESEENQNTLMRSCVEAGA